MTKRTMTFAQSLEGIECLHKAGNLETTISGLSHDSRKISEQELFIALSGQQYNGQEFIAKAIAGGASAIVAEQFIEDCPLPQATVKDSRLALSKIASNFYANPSDELLTVGITGTNGKTSLAILIQQILNSALRPSARIGTLGHDLGNGQQQALHTTPESNSLQKFLRQALDNGQQAAVIEVSSHALQLNRVANCFFDLAIFTNLTRDHLDFHQKMEDYFNAKRKLFAQLKPSSRINSIINLDDPYGQRLAQTMTNKRYLFGRQRGDFNLAKAKSDNQGQQLIINTPQGELAINSPLVGDFQQQNILAAVAAAVALKIDPQKIKEGIENVKNIPGRLEKINNHKNIEVYVDYAHTPAALTNILRTMRKICRGRLITIFGCGGDRDQGKRPLMAKAVAKDSDLVLITSDNPRSEQPEKIIQQIKAGLPETINPLNREELKDAGSGYFAEADRRQAIALGLSICRPKDTLIVAGKGHETYQEINGQRFDFDDRQIIKEISGGVDNA